MASSRRIHCDNNKAVEQETALEPFSAWDSKRIVHDDCIYARHGSNRAYRNTLPIERLLSFRRS
jgi:hypothetical protein